MEYRHERFVLNRFCEFRNREVESDFMEYEKIANLNIVRVLSLIMGLIFAMFIFSDYYYHGTESGFAVILVLRGIALSIAIVIFTQVGKIPRFDITQILISLSELVVFVIYLLKIYYQENQNSAMQFMTIMLFMWTVFLIPNKVKNCLITGGTILAGYISFCFVFLKSSEPPSFVQQGIFLSICFITCTFFIFGRETSRRRQFATEKLLEFMSITDRLTGIYNRGRFEAVLSLWIKNMRHNPFSLLLFDIDDFKKVNDMYGHTAGDQVLVGIADVVTAKIRDDDIFARWGGEEFVVLFSKTGLEQATELAERLRKAVASNVYGEAGKITISIGVVEYRQGESITDFVKRADEKMYEAKKTGKNRVMA